MSSLHQLSTYFTIFVQMSLREIVKINNIDRFQPQSKPRLFHRKIKESRMDTMNIFNDFIRRHDSLIGEYSNEIYFLQVAINIMRNISALCGYHKLTSLVTLLIDKIVESCIDDFLWFAESVKSAGVNDVHSSWFDCIDDRSEHFVVMLICWRTAVCP